MDVISINYYTLGVDQDFIGRGHQWTGDKPMMWSEFYYTSSAESSCGGGNADMATQKARGEAYRQYEPPAGRQPGTCPPGGSTPILLAG
jgi:hypothetical protein